MGAYGWVGHVWGKKLPQSNSEHPNAVNQFAVMHCQTPRYCLHQLANSFTPSYYEYAGVMKTLCIR